MIQFTYMDMIIGGEKAFVVNGKKYDLCDTLSFFEESHQNDAGYRKPTAADIKYACIKVLVHFKKAKQSNTNRGTYTYDYEYVECDYDDPEHYPVHFIRYKDLSVTNITC